MFFFTYEVVVDQQGKIKFDTSEFWMDKDHRGLLTVLDEPLDKSGPTSGASSDFYLHHEAIAYESGVIRVSSLGISEPRRAIVIVLNESPVFTRITGPDANDPPSVPIRVGDRVIDMDDVNELYDYGDVVYVGFGLEHQPPHVYLRGAGAEALREYFGGQIPNRKEIPPLAESDVQALEKDAQDGKPLDSLTALQLIRTTRELRRERDAIIANSAGTIQWLFDNCEALAYQLSMNEVRSVKCLLGDGCKVRADGRCEHTDRQ